MTQKIFIAFIVLIVANSCKKDNIDSKNKQLTSISSNFFNSSTTTDPTIIKVKNNLQSLNEQQEFVSKIVKIGGLPKWDKSEVTNQKLNSILSKEGEQDTLVIIPIISEDFKMVIAILIATVHENEFSYQLILLRDYKSFSQEELSFIKVFAALDNKVFFHKNFKIDTSLIINNASGVFRLKSSSLDDGDPCDIIEDWYDPNGIPDDGDEYYLGTWHYAGDCPTDDEPQSPVVIILGGTGGAGQPAGNVYTLPDLGGLTVGAANGLNPFPYTPIFSFDQQLSYLVEQLQLSNEETQWLANNQTTTIFLFSKLYGGYTIERAQRFKNAIKYLMEHPGTDLNRLYNQFLTPREKLEDPIDVSFWDDPNLNIPPQPLPTLGHMKTNYPSHDDVRWNTSLKFYDYLGGDIRAAVSASLPDANTCAARLSHALNFSGVTIPHIPGKTFSATNGKYYFKSAQDIIEWMKRTFGTSTNPNNYNANHHVFTGVQGGDEGQNFPTLLSGMSGIYGMLPMSPSAFEATGHVSIMTNAVCDGGCYFDSNVYQIHVWVLSN